MVLLFLVAFFCASLVDAQLPNIMGAYIKNIQTTAGGAATNAAAYYDSTRGRLSYTFSNSATELGTVNPTLITGRGSGTPIFTGEYVSLSLTADGIPMVSFFKAGGSPNPGSLCFMRANDVSGASWPDDIRYVDTRGNVGMWTSLSLSSSSFPAIAYADNTVQFNDPGAAGGVKYVTARDTAGSSWNDPVTVARGGSVQYITMMLVSSRPAISFYNVTDGNLYYVHAINAEGTEWPAPTIVSTGRRGQFAAMKANAAGDLFIASVSESTRRIALARSTDGANWTVTDGPVAAPVISLDFDFLVGTQIPFLVYGVSEGNAAAQQRIELVRATNTEGTGWNAPLVVREGTLVGYASVALISNVPTVMWSDIKPGYVFLRQTSNSSALALATTTFLYDNGAIT